MVPDFELSGTGERFVGGSRWEVSLMSSMIGSSQHFALPTSFNRKPARLLLIASHSLLHQSQDPGVLEAQRQANPRKFGHEEEVL